MDFTKETNKAIEKVINEKLPEMIEIKAASMIEDIVSNIFRWGDVKDQIKKKVEESINVNLQKFDLIDYNALIAKTINENLIQQINLQPIIDMTANIVGFVNRKTIKLEEIAEIFMDASKDENEREGEGQISFFVEENTKYNWIEISADIEANQTEDQCCFRFLISTDGDRKGKIFSFRTREKYYHNSQEKLTPARLVNMNKLESEIFRLYSAQVEITNYDEEIDTYWERYY
ncbi:hypothetical protein [Chryseobacterium sp. 2R14A]|uniref:hypothetical protein n=1 Tax=Chryseobacterium sp. 2R14A TaxID=3380353 RepID=UPI003CF71B76